jgi:hypothetical protein
VPLHPQHECAYRQPHRHAGLCVSQSKHFADLLQLIDIDDEGFLSMMNDNGDTRSDLRIPEGEIGDEIRTRFEA